jgi:hypothetical protein
MCSRRETRCGRRDRSSPGPPQRCPGGGSEQGTTQGTAKRRQRSAAGWRMSNRSRLIVPSSAGNSPQRTRGREAADRSELPLAGQMSRTLGRASIFPQRQGLADWAGWAPGRERLLRTQGAHFFSVRSERLDRGAGCPNWARPDLWEPRVSNHPRPPGLRQAKPGRGGRKQDGTLAIRNLLSRPAGCKSRTGKDWPSTGTECCVVRG